MAYLHSFSKNYPCSLHTLWIAGYRHNGKMCGLCGGLQWRKHGYTRLVIVLQIHLCPLYLLNLSFTDQCHWYQCLGLLPLNSTKLLSALQVSSAVLSLHLAWQSIATQLSSASLVMDWINRVVFVVTGQLTPASSQLYLLHLLTHGTTSLLVSIDIG